ncbi:MAG: winged helix DNA-binding protein [bacterium]|nr:winged helix DNA-binding protein [bacterium]
MKENTQIEQTIDVHGMEKSFYLIGLLNEFVNRFQSVGDRFFSDISWKQGFLLACIQLFNIPPTLGELSEAMGCSHQNVKQMLLKLQKMGYVKLLTDEEDKRKQRVHLTDKAKKFSDKNDQPSKAYMAELFQAVQKEQLEVTIKTMMQLDETLKQLSIKVGGIRNEEDRSV